MRLFFSPNPRAIMPFIATTGGFAGQLGTLFAEFLA